MHGARLIRRRIIIALVAVVALLSLSHGVPVAAAGRCPPTFTLLEGISDADRDGNGLFCYKLVRQGTQIVLIDDR